MVQRFLNFFSFFLQILPINCLVTALYILLVGLTSLALIAFIVAIIVVVVARGCNDYTHLLIYDHNLGLLGCWLRGLHRLCRFGLWHNRSAGYELIHAIIELDIGIAHLWQDVGRKVTPRLGHFAQSSLLLRLGMVVRILHRQDHCLLRNIRLLNLRYAVAPTESFVRSVNLLRWMIGIYGVVIE